MKIYFDNCSLQRPLDSKIQVRIAVEAEAVLGVLSLCESGQVELISSEALAFEISRSLSPDRVTWALEVLSRARVYVQVNDQIESRARLLVERGINPLDALHLASAEEARADYFCTCDDQLLRSGRSMTDLNTKVVSPIELVGEVGQ
jgi:predicted nucleic acid-binding protein